MRVSGTLRSGAARLRGRSPVLTAVMTLLSGTLAAQVIGFVLQIGIARTYSATDKGLFGIYGSVASLVVTVAAARFDLSVVLPRDDDGARVLVRLASRCIVVSSLLTSLACVVAASWVSSRYGSAELAAWLCGSGITVGAMPVRPGAPARPPWARWRAGTAGWRCWGAPTSSSTRCATRASTC